MLTWLNPAMLWALPAVSVPIVIHLINRARYRTVPWAAMDFLLQAQKVTRRRVRMEHWLLLLLRTLAILLLVLALARPAFSDLDLEFGGERSALRVVLLDRSLSMSHTRDGQSALERGRAAIGALVRQLSERRPQDRLTVLATGMDKPVLEAATLATPADREAIRKALAGVTPASRPAAWTTELGRLADFVEGRAGELTAGTLVSDFKQPDFGGGAAGALAPMLARLRDARVPLAGLAVGHDDPTNVALGNLRLVSPHVVAGFPARFEVTVSAYGAPVADLPLTLSLGRTGEALPLGSLASLVPGQPKRYPFEYTFPAAGAQALSVQIPKDPFTADNQIALAIEVKPRIAVLIVDGAPAEGGGERFEGEADYLYAAFLFGKRSATGVDVSVRPERELARLDFAEYDVVFFANVEQFPEVPTDPETGTGYPALAAGAPSPESGAVLELRPAVRDRLEAYVRGGGAAVFYLGDLVNPIAYTEDLYRDGTGVFPGRVTRLYAIPEHTEGGYGVTVTAPEHPLMAALAGPGTAAIRARAYWMLDLSANVIAPDGAEAAAPTGRSGAPRATVLARFTDREHGTPPAIVVSGAGAGTVLVVTTAADLDWGNWPRLPSFLVFNHLMANTLAARSAAGRTFAPGANLERIYRPDEFTVEATLRPPDFPKHPSLAVPGRLLQEDDPGQGARYRVFREGALARPGVYELELTTVSTHEPMLEFYAVNADRRESDLRPVAPEAFARNFGPLGLTLSRAGGGSGLDVQTPMTRLGWALLCALGIVLILETLVAAFAQRRRDESL